MTMTSFSPWTSCLVAAVLVLAQSPLASVAAAAAAESSGTCLKSLNTIYEAEKKVRDDSVVRRYVLCGNTEFYVALNFDGDGTPLDGQYPIPIGRPNIHVLCGEDGSSENNCQLVRGLVHVGVVDEFNTGSTADNILLQGLTFFRATSVNVIAMIGGDITIQDCIFKRNRNVASIYAVSPQSTSGRRKLSLTANSNDDDDGLAEYLDQRSLQEVDGSSTNATATNTGLQIIIIDSVFSDNVLGASPGADSTALIYSVGASVDMSHSVMVGTTKDVQKYEELPHLIYVESAPLTLDSNCFIGNHEGIAPVVAQQATVVESRLNFNQRTTSHLPSTNCEFIAHNSLSSSSNSSTNFECKPSEADVCGAKSTADYRFPCVSYLDDIYFSEWDVEDSDVPRTYILCPHTTFRVGSRHDEEGTPQGGSYPIILGRSNIRVLCGANGSLENGCDVVNGVVQVAHFDEFQTGGEPILNALVQGISFAGASSLNVLVSGSGDVFFRDCVFKDNSNVAAVYVQALLDPMTRSRRKLASVVPELVENLHRGLATGRRQQESAAALVAQFDSCVFANNTIGSAINPVSGLITNDNATLTLMNSLIVNTMSEASTEDLGYFEVGYLVGNFNGEATLAKNCFYDNDVTIAPVLSTGRTQAMFNAGRQAMAPPVNNSLAQEMSETSSRFGNNAEEEALSATEFDLTTDMSSSNVTWNPPIDHMNARCEFIATITGPEDVLGSLNPELIEFTCDTFDSDMCHHPDAPSSFPSMSPSDSPQPTSSPSGMPSPYPTRQYLSAATTSGGQSGAGAFGMSNLLGQAILVSMFAMLVL